MELYDDVVVPAVATAAGEKLAQLVDVPAGPWLAIALSEIDCTELTHWDMPAYLQGWDRMQSYAAAHLAAGVAHFASMPDVGAGVEKEIALALREPVGAAQTRVWRAKRLMRMLPRMWRWMASGDLSERHVSKLLDATGSVDDADLMAKIEDGVLARAGGKTATELARAAKDLLKRLDPSGAQRRAHAARAEADVALYPGEDGMGDVVIHAPVEDAVIVKTAVDAYAAAAKSCGDDRPIGVLRAEAPLTWASSYLAGIADGRVPRAAGRPIEVGITMPLRTALGLDDVPGELPGFGVIPRDVIKTMIGTELPKLRLMVIDPDSGRLVYRAESSYRPTPDQVAQVRATYVFSVGPGSQIMAIRTDTDHVHEAPTGPTQIGNLLPLDRPWHIGKTRRQLSVTLDDNGAVHVTTVLGQSRSVTPYDYRMTLDAGLAPPTTEDEPR
jgi:hypothetical protein